MPGQARRHREPRAGAGVCANFRQTVREKQTYSRWCFADLGTACDFIEQFGGTLAKLGYESHSPAMRREALQSCFIARGRSDR